MAPKGRTRVSYFHVTPVWCSWPRKLDGYSERGALFFWISGRFSNRVPLVGRYLFVLRPFIRISAS